MSILGDFISLFYPQVCEACDTPLMRGEELLCLGCLADLPKNNFVNFAENPVADIFIGRVNIVYGNSYCHFDKGGKVQHLLHRLKYKGRKEIGHKLGLLFGYDLIKTTEFNEIDAIVPVPLHRRKQISRGYNQSIEICKGISEALGKPILLNNLIRKKYTTSQTSKSRYERWQNVSGIFDIRKIEKFKGKHLLLVDDVITTGATLEACSEALLKIEGVRISIAAIANA